MNDKVQQPNADDLKNQMEYAEKQLEDLTNKEKVLLFDLDQVLASKRFLTFKFLQHSKIENVPSKFEWKYFSGNFKEYLTPA